ncbi:MAG: oligosaccharide flippase family protein [Deltaproteobacteria bacterium]|nr:oligosaccharide flippase family protein [Deltaproteobacteria bacterium]
MDTAELQRRARRGVLALVGRTALVQLAVLGGSIALARLLDPADFGVFAIVQFALAFIAYFGDAGLGAALIQKKEPPTQGELASVFWLQLLLGLAVVLLVGLGAGAVQLVWPGLPPAAVWLLRALSLGLLLTLPRVIPCILMERELQFGRLGALDVAGQVAFYLAAVPLAALGAGVWSLALGVLGQAVVVTALAFALRPWRPTLALDRRGLRAMVRFGLPFQAKNLVGFVNGALTPLYGGVALGERRLGYINWAQATAYFPLKLVEIMARVTFPLLSRLQHDHALLSRELGRSIRICAIATLGYAALIAALGEPIVRLVYTDKWLPALPLLYLYAGAISLGFLAPIVASALDALGRPGLFLRLSVAWTALAWLAVLFATPRWGMVGFVAGYCLHVVVGNIAVIFVVRRLVPQARLWPSVRAAIAGALAAGLLGRLVLAPHVAGLGLLGLGVAAMAVVFAAVVLLLDPALARELRGWAQSHRRLRYAARGDKMRFR